MINTMKKTPKIRNTPWFERITAETLMRWYYMLPMTHEIVIQNVELIPSGKPVIFVLDSSDPNLFIPFLLGLYRFKETRYTSFWAPNTYYEKKLTRAILPFTNSIPITTRKDLIVDRFLDLNHRIPTPVEMIRLLEFMDTPTLKRLEPVIETSPAMERFLGTFGEERRDILKNYLSWFNTIWNKNMEQILLIHRKSILENNLNILGYININDDQPSTVVDKSLLIQIAAKLSAVVVPVHAKAIESTDFKKRKTMAFQIQTPFLPTVDKIESKNSRTSQRALENYLNKC